MDVIKLQSKESGMSFIFSTPYSFDHEWYELSHSESFCFYEEVQSKGLDALNIEILKSIPYDKNYSFKDNKRAIKDLEKECIHDFCKVYGSNKICNKVTGALGNTSNGKSSYVYIYKGESYYTGNELHEALLKSGVELPIGATLAFLHRDKYLSKENQLKYPTLIDDVQIIKFQK